MNPKIAVVIPCYKARASVLDVIKKIGPEVWRIYVVDDACPENSGQHVKTSISDPRVQVIFNGKNLGVGGAVMAGYRAALAEGAEVIVKIDGDGQMDPAMIPRFTAPIRKGRADYTKGNRFYDLAHIARMPTARLFGNAILSFMAKLSTGYWNIFDPTNGYTAIHARVAAFLPMDRVSRRYFFETDMLFRLNTMRAVVVDIPMDAVYGGEQSHLKISSILWEFLARHAHNLAKRIFYNYFLRDMTLASVELVVGGGLFVFGLVFGGAHWIKGIHNHTPTPLGTIMIAAMSLLVGLQLILAFLGFDIGNVPKRPVHDDLPDSHH
ncbi:MAG: glycosyltransferase family 2 protein [Kiritimatiellae bacterium]|nr:glycosyltransferase family 2 protein [Kiritimatiellia bacterium]